MTQPYRQPWRRWLLALLVLGLVLITIGYGYQQYRQYRHDAAVQRALEALLQNKFGS